MGTGPRDRYERRRRSFEAERDRESERSRAASRARLGVFVVLLGSAVWAELRPGPVAIAATTLAVGAFVGLVLVHQRIRERERWVDVLAGVNRDGLLRLDRAWEALPYRSAPVDLAQHPYAGDLDIFGKPGLAQLLGPVGTPAGVATLGRWLLAPAAPAEVRERQAAARELAPLNDLRDALAGHGRRAGEVGERELAPFLGWAEEPPLLPAHPAWRWAARMLPIATVALIALNVAGTGPPRLWLLPLMASAALTFGPPGKRIRATFRQAFMREGMFHGYPELLATIAAAPAQAPRLDRLRRELTAAGLSAAGQMARLRRLMHLADLRYSPMLYLPVQLLTLWDFHVLDRIDAWRGVAGPHVRRWFDAAGEFEALAALAALAHDHPEWSFPELLDEDGPTLTGTRLGHPMLPPAARVDNDVVVGPPGTFLLVTGSNMSGKSTLLRAIGQNTVLAFAGAPVCAAALRVPRVSLHTSIHVEDSLVAGVSFFMAQLQRMKRIVAAADARWEEGGRVLFLLDEILQGTNTAERRIAATRVIRHLVQRGAIGAVTTHDLELAGEAALAGAAKPVHFRETVHTADGRPVMTFDYVLREGVATSTNALKLMEIVGLAD
jgi:hypothetical protein